MKKIVGFFRPLPAAQFGGFYPPVADWTLDIQFRPRCRWIKNPCLALPAGIYFFKKAA
jgi:hypothetical protein